MHREKTRKAFLVWQFSPCANPLSTRTQQCNSWFRKLFWTRPPHPHHQYGRLLACVLHSPAPRHRNVQTPCFLDQCDRYMLGLVFLCIHFMVSRPILVLPLVVFPITISLAVPTSIFSIFPATIFVILRLKLCLECFTLKLLQRFFPGSVNNYAVCN